MVTRFITTFLFVCLFQGCGLQMQTSNATVNIGGEAFQLEIVRDMQSRAQGLMHRDEIPADGGMLFIFPDTAPRSFWMKNCLIPIDLLFLDSRGTITATHEMAIETPQSQEESDWEYENRLSHYWSNSPARFAIELRSGSIRRLGLRTNQHISLDLQHLRSIAR